VDWCGTCETETQKATANTILSKTRTGALNARFLRVGSLILLVVSGGLVAFISQASSPDYGRLFWAVSPFALLHFALVTIYFTFVRGWTQWGAAAVGFVALSSFFEFAFRYCHSSA
jgi:hypothetical protein